MRIAPERVEIVASVPVRAREEPVVDRLSLRVLEALADSLDYSVDDLGGERVFSLCFSRDRPS
jgi:hypothetical protein